MGSHIVKDTDEQGRQRTTIYCSRDREPKVCSYCPNPGVRLCDFPLEGGTCDRRLCIRHPFRVAYQTDYCPEHAGASAPS